MPIDLNEWESEYKAGVQAKGAKWQRRFLAATGIAEKAKSEAAETAYGNAVRAAADNKTRQKKLSNVTDEDIKAPVRAGGSSLYTTPAQAKAAKARKNFADYAPLIDSTTASLVPRTTDPIANIDNRVKPLATALHNKKLGK